MNGKPIKIYIDLIVFDLQKAGGISVYWYELLRRFLRDGRFEIVLIDSGLEKDNIFYKKLDLSGVKTLVIRKPFNRYRAVNYRETEPHYFVSSYYRYSKNKNAVNLTVVHDFTYEYYAKGLRKFMHTRQKYRAVKKSLKIICASENTLLDLNKFVKLRAGQETRVIYTGINEIYHKMTEGEINAVLSALPSEQRQFVSVPFVLYVGGRAGYKNWAQAVELFKSLPEGYRMISVGGGGLSPTEEVVLGVALSRYLHIPFADEIILCLLYNKAQALLYLSKYEGFGVPVAEAQKCGCPVVALNRSSIPEVAGPGAILMEDFSVENMVEYVNQLSAPKFRDKVIADGLQQSQNFSWDKCFKEILNAINPIL
jgi:mannosyltransferase